MSGPMKWSIRLFGTFVALLVLALSSVVLLPLAVVPAIISWFATTQVAKAVLRSPRHDDYGVSAVDVSGACVVGLFAGLVSGVIAMFVTFAIWAMAPKL